MTTERDPPIRFHRDKFLAAIEYIIAHRTKEPATLGKTKLHKCLYFADMLHYLDTGVPLTGVEYIKQPFGPTARYLNWALKELQSRGRIKVETKNYFGLEKFDFTFLADEPRTNLFSDNARGLLDDVIEFVCGHSAKEISEISHAEPWRIVEFGEPIPYHTAHLLLPPPEVSLRDREVAS